MQNDEYERMCRAIAVNQLVIGFTFIAGAMLGATIALVLV